MLRIKNRRANVPNGYQYVQRETGWDASKVMPHTNYDFNAVCQALRQHRMANPQFKFNTSLAAIEAEVEAVNVARIAAMPGADIYLQDVGSASSESFQPAPSKTLHQLAVDGAKAISAGVANVTDWIDSGIQPVSSELSTKRAETCIKCPKNEMGALSRFFTIPAATLIKLRLEKFHARKLTTPFDDKLGTCSACMCRNQLKVHEPIDLVMKHTTPEIKAELDPGCWVLGEWK